MSPPVHRDASALIDSFAASLNGPLEFRILISLSESAKQAGQKDRHVGDGLQGWSDSFHRGPPWDDLWQHARPGATHVIRGCESFDRGGEGRGIYPAGPCEGARRKEVSVSSSSGTFLRTKVRAPRRNELPLRAATLAVGETIATSRRHSRREIARLFSRSEWRTAASSR